MPPSDADGDIATSELVPACDGVRHGSRSVAQRSYVSHSRWPVQAYGVVVIHVGLNQGQRIDGIPIPTHNKNSHMLELPSDNRKVSGDYRLIVS